MVEAELRRFVTECDQLRDEVRRPLTEWEDAEKARTEALQQRLVDLRALADVIDTAGNYLPSADIQTRIQEAKSVVLDDSWQERSAEAGVAKDSTIQQLEASLAVAQNASTKRLSWNACAKRQRKKHVSNVKKLYAAKQQNRLSVMQKQKHRPRLMLLHAVKLKPRLQLNAQSAKKLKPSRKQSVKQKPLRKKLSRKRATLSQQSVAVRKKRKQFDWQKRNASPMKRRAAQLTKSIAAP